MNASVVGRMAAWRSFVWAGAVGSVLAWAWVWFLAGGATAVMLLIAVATIVLAYRGTAGMRLALVGLTVAGVAMFLASLYWLALVLFATNGQATAMDALSTSLFPMVAAIVLLMGSVAGFRHVKSA